MCGPNPYVEQATIRFWEFVHTDEGRVHIAELAAEMEAAISLDDMFKDHIRKGIAWAYANPGAQFTPGCIYSKSQPV